MAVRRLEGRLALITGASRGLGAALAERFAAEGAELILTARTVGGLEATDDKVRRAGGKALLVPLDLADHDAIDRLAAPLAERFGRLDVLVGAAAELGSLAPIAHADPKVWDRVLAVALIANMRLLRALDPLLRASASGRVLFASCAAASGEKPFWSAYAVAKAGLETMARLYDVESRQGGVRAHIVDPGPMSTALRKQAYPGEAPDAHPITDAILDRFVDLAAFSEVERPAAAG